MSSELKRATVVEGPGALEIIPTAHLTKFSPSNKLIERKIYLVPISVNSLQHTKEA
jgi:hypothetical protein